VRDQMPRMRTFELDRPRALDVIAEVWGLGQHEPAHWRLDRFGPGLASSIENLTTVAFARHRKVVRGPAVEVRVLPIDEPDPHLLPALVCVDTGRGPMLSIGIESLPDALPDPWGCSHETVLGGLQRLLDIAAEAYTRDPMPSPLPDFAPHAAPIAGPGGGVPHPIG
jgi:hypothetical protein